MELAFKISHEAYLFAGKGGVRPRVISCLLQRHTEQHQLAIHCCNNANLLLLVELHSHMCLAVTESALQLLKCSSKGYLSGSDNAGVIIIVGAVSLRRSRDNRSRWQAPLLCLPCYKW